MSPGIPLFRKKKKSINCTPKVLYALLNFQIANKETGSVMLFTSFCGVFPEWVCCVFTLSFSADDVRMFVYFIRSLL